MAVSWTGTRHRVDRRFFADCFNSSAVPSRVLASDDLKAVMITLSGGDGAGAYEVTPIVSDDGSVRRCADDKVPDRRLSPAVARLPAARCGGRRLRAPSPVRR
jgi:hypothetical protein